MEIKIRSIKIIKPLRPTPENQLSFKLSLFDQFSAFSNIDLILYYKSSCEVSISDRCTHLVKSLSEVLCSYYPLAGIVKEDGLEIDCCDQGVKYLETRVTMTLDNFLKKGPKIDARKLVGAPDEATTTLVTIQVNVFDCGALAIGVSASHKVTDTCNLIRFISEWAGINRTGVSKGAFCPSFDNLAAFFPPMEVPLSNYPPTHSDPEAIIVNKRFLFNGTTISKLRAKVGSSNRRHSRVTLVTAVIWKALISIDQVKNGSIRDCLLTPAMNLRGKAGSPISKSSFGNVWAPYPIRFLQKEMKPEFLDLVLLIDNTTRRTTTWLLKASSKEICTQTRACHVEVDGELTQNKFCIYASWCSFPIYDVDFGWGKPFWASGIGSTIEMVTLMDGKDGDGIEAWVSLKEKDMNLFEQDLDILAFTS